MEIININEKKVTRPVCLMIGNFDGVHLGHQRIIEGARVLAAEQGARIALLGFEPHPLKVLAPEKAPKLLQTATQKRALLEHQRVDYCLIQPFTAELSRYSPEAFVASLKERVNFKFLLVGFNFRFGYRRQGTPETLKLLAPKHGFQVIEMPPCELDGKIVSSSRIRGLVAEGDLETAAGLLGRPYFLEGTVLRGDRLGRELRSPTANIRPENELLPRFGVYASWARVKRRWYRAITNIGVAPTLGRSELLTETHLFEFTDVVYDHHLLVCLGRFLRPELKFENLVALKKQIRADILDRGDLPDSNPPAFSLY